MVEWTRQGVGRLFALVDVVAVTTCCGAKHQTYHAHTHTHTHAMQGAPVLFEQIAMASGNLTFSASWYLQ